MELTTLLEAPGSRAVGERDEKQGKEATLSTLCFIFPTYYALYPSPGYVLYFLSHFLFFFLLGFNPVIFLFFFPFLRVHFLRGYE